VNGNVSETGQTKRRLSPKDRIMLNVEGIAGGKAYQLGLGRASRVPERGECLLFDGVGSACRRYDALEEGGGQVTGDR